MTTTKLCLHGLCFSTEDTFPKFLEVHAGLVCLIHILLPSYEDAINVFTAFLEGFSFLNSVVSCSKLFSYSVSFLTLRHTDTHL